MPQDNPPRPVAADDRRPAGDVRTSSAQVAHELANLLDGSLRNISLAKRRLATDSDAGATNEDDAAALEKLETASAAMQQMAQMLQQWMQQSSVVGDHPAEAEKENAIPASSASTVGEMIAQVVRLTGPDAERARVQVRAHLTANASARPAGELQSVVINAVRNSIEAFAEQDRSTLPTGQIDIVARTTGSYFELYIHDNGPGLDPRITDRTERLHIGSTTKQGGHGIGLAHCHAIAERLGGVMIVENDIAGGTTLTVRHPLDRKSSAKSSAA